AADYFGAMVEAYDSLIRRAVPRYEEMTARLVDYLPESAASILELGCGTGNLSLALAARYPNAEITFVDAAPEMLATSRARLASSHPELTARAHFIESRFEELRLLPGSFGLVTSCISLHHVKEKAPLYRTLFTALAPGGSFCFADQLRGGSDFNHQRNWTRWLEFCRLPGHCTQAEIESLLDHAGAHDHYTSLPDHFEMVSVAGFQPADCVWRNWIGGIITADKP